ncbi:hypothetical protein FQR65_LT07089 [Abscondita terminalis]|nr:hypothetical protein FQR65_LT07089 [Abscondita terminalis]
MIIFWLIALLFSDSSYFFWITEAVHGIRAASSEKLFALRLFCSIITTAKTGEKGEKP